MRTEALGFVGTVVLLWLSFFKPCRASGSLEIKLKSYESTCEDNTFLFGIFTTPCDAVFEICIDEPGTVDFQSCAYDHQTSTVHENQNQVTFYEQIGQGISNPRIIHFDNFQNPRVMFSVKIKDDELIMSTEHLATLSQTFSFTPASGKSQAGWTSSYMLKVDGDGYRYRINFQYRAYCDAYYYTGRCDVYCRATDDASGHYTCHPVTGQKQCFPGWEGENCDIDINECTQAPCHNKAECVNQQGTYECVCSNGYSGQNCGVVSSQCASAPCQHGGTCSGDTWSYTCSCPSEWTGHNCNTMKDFCESNPCQNYGTCQSTLGGYVCNCTLGTKGKNCETEVNACDSLPCQHGSTCKRKPAGEYECGCKEEYEGKNCEVLKNPCDSAPCLNAGICGRVSHDTYTCLCLRGWEGKRCQIRSIVSNGTAERQEGKESSSKIPFLPIILGCMSGLILLLIILLLLAFKKRRRQKASTSSESGNVPPFASLDAIVSRNVPMGYPNLLYDQTNASNASLERSRGPGSFLRPPMPLPKPRPSGGCGGGGGGGGGGCKEDCYPGKVGGMPGEEEEEEEGGAVGGVMGVTVLGRDGGVAWKKGKGEAERHRTTSTGPAQNDYADFAELQRDSIAARRETAQDDPSSQEDFEDLAQEDDYQELNDLHLHQLKDSAGSSLGKSNA